MSNVISWYCCVLNFDEDIDLQKTSKSVPDERPPFFHALMDGNDGHCEGMYNGIFIQLSDETIVASSCNENIENTWSHLYYVCELLNVHREEIIIFSDPTFKYTSISIRSHEDSSVNMSPRWDTKLWENQTITFMSAQSSGEFLWLHNNETEKMNPDTFKKFLCYYFPHNFDNNEDTDSD